MDVDSLIWWDRRRGGQSLAHWGGMDIAEGINSPFSSGRKKNEREENDYAVCVELAFFSKNM